MKEESKITPAIQVKLFALALYRVKERFGTL